MTTLGAVISGNAPTLFALFIEAALKGTLLIAAAGTAAFALRGATASLRHLLWSFSFVAMLAIPAMSLVLPRWRMAMVPLPPTSFPQSATRNPLPAPRHPLTAARYPLSVDSDPVPEASGPMPEVTAGTALQSSTRLLSSVSLIDSLALLWLGGMLAALISIAGGMITLRRLARRSIPIAGADWQNLLIELKADLRIARDVRLLVSRSAAMPATWGVIHPIVLLPAASKNWDDARRRVVLLHELAHIQRNDWLMQVVAQLCCTVYWFHPGVWYAAQQLRAERELACDEHVLGVGVNACDYAAHLLEIALSFRAPAGTSIAAVAMARPSQLEARLNAILSENLANRWRASRPVRAATLATLAALTVPLAAMQPWREAASGNNAIGLSNGAAHKTFASPSRSESPIASSDTFRWKGTVPAGQWVEILSGTGDIRAEVSNDGQVEILAVTKTGDARNVKIAMDRTNRTTRFCVVTAAAASDSTRPCQTRTSGELIYGWGAARVDFLVKVPARVGISLHTVHGNITAESVKSYVWGTSSRGDIRITTTDLAEASTEVGSIYAEFGRRSWRQDLEFLSESGNIAVRAPSDAKMMIDVETSAGTARSEFPGEVKPYNSGERIFTTVVRGRGMLTLRTGRGAVKLLRGGIAVGEVSDMSMSDGDARLHSVDPKPNPQPDPASEPNPNPNPNPNSNPNPNPEYNADPILNPAGEGATDATSNSDDPTGERVPVTIPEGLVGRFSDAMIRGWPDAQVIARLRDIAATHVKQHPADLVRERSEWALTLVRNGEIVMPLRNALTNSDWRVRAYAAWALGETRDPRAADLLTGALGDAHWRVRMHAASGLERIGGARSVDPLITALADNYWQVRISAVDALAAIGDHRAVSPLRAVAERDSRWIVRDQALGALQRIR